MVKFISSFYGNLKVRIHNNTSKLYNFFKSLFLIVLSGLIMFWISKADLNYDFRGEKYIKEKHLLEAFEQEKILENPNKNNRLDSKKYIKMILEQDKLIYNDPYKANSYLIRAKALIKLERNEEGLKDINQALTINPFSFIGYLQRGNMHLKNNMPSLAYEDFKVAIKLAKNEKEKFIAEEAMDLLVDLKNNIHTLASLNSKEPAQIFETTHNLKNKILNNLNEIDNLIMSINIDS